ncbi:MAG: hypothetical protein IPL28_16645, partial [Chloroflexi bacterium]|nr:hypothetical protein [Chloroflexota bacterium]
MAGQYVVGVGARPWRERKPYEIIPRATHPRLPRAQHGWPTSGVGRAEWGLHHIHSAQPHPYDVGRGELLQQGGGFFHGHAQQGR